MSDLTELQATEPSSEGWLDGTDGLPLWCAPFTRETFETHAWTLIRRISTPPKLRQLLRCKDCGCRAELFILDGKARALMHYAQPGRGNLTCGEYACLTVLE